MASENLSSVLSPWILWRKTFSETEEPFKICLVLHSDDNQTTETIDAQSASKQARF